MGRNNSDPLRSNGFYDGTEPSQSPLPNTLYLSQPPKKKKSKSVFRQVLLIFVIALLGLLTGSGAGLAYYGFGDPQETLNGTPAAVPAVEGGDEPEQMSNRVTFLLIGVDDRKGHKSLLTDTLILASVDPDTKIISLLSIPRDTAVLGYTKINEVASYRGLDGLVKVVSDLTGARIDGYVKTNFEGFKDIIDTLGGIDLYVEKDMYYETGDKEDGVINLKQGMQHMDGTLALQYARFRNDAIADIGRTARQQKVIMAMAKKALSSESIGKLPQLVPQAVKAVESSLSLKDMLKLAGMAKSFKSENMVTATLPGKFSNAPDGASIWEVDTAYAKTVTANLFKGISTSKRITGAGTDHRPPGSADGTETGSGETNTNTNTNTNPGNNNDPKIPSDPVDPSDPNIPEDPPGETDPPEKPPVDDGGGEPPPVDPGGTDPPADG